MQEPMVYTEFRGHELQIVEAGIDTIHSQIDPVHC